jgi:hypothetical protein
LKSVHLLAPGVGVPARIGQDSIQQPAGNKSRPDHELYRRLQVRQTGDMGRDYRDSSGQVERPGAFEEAVPGENVIVSAGGERRFDAAIDVVVHQIGKEIQNSPLLQ